MSALQSYTPNSIKIMSSNVKELIKKIQSQLQEKQSKFEKIQQQNGLSLNIRGILQQSKKYLKYYRQFAKDTLTTKLDIKKSRQKEQFYKQYIQKEIHSKAKQQAAANILKDKINDLSQRIKTQQKLIMLTQGNSKDMIREKQQEVLKLKLQIENLKHENTQKQNKISADEKQKQNNLIQHSKLKRQLEDLYKKYGNRQYQFFSQKAKLNLQILQIKQQSQRKQKQLKNKYDDKLLQNKSLIQTINGQKQVIDEGLKRMNVMKLQVQQVKTQNKFKTIQNDQIKQKLIKTQVQNIKKNEIIDEQLKRINSMKIQIQKLNAQNKIKSTQNDKLKQKLIKSQQQNKNINDQINKKIDQNKNMINIINELTQQNDKLKKGIDLNLISKDQLVNANQKIEKLSKKLIQEVYNKKQKIKQLQGMIKQQRQQRYRQQQEQKSKFKQQKLMNQKVSSQLKKQKQKAIEQNTFLVNRITQLEDQIIVTSKLALINIELQKRIVIIENEKKQMKNNMKNIFHKGKKMITQLRKQRDYFSDKSKKMALQQKKMNKKQKLVAQKDQQLFKKIGLFKDMPNLFSLDFMLQ